VGLRGSDGARRFVTVSACDSCARFRAQSSTVDDRHDTPDDAWHSGAALALAGAAIFYGSAVLAAYAVAFLAATHVFVGRVRGADAPGDVRRRVRRLLPARASLARATRRVT
jgi:hypothetical protein